MEALFVQVNEPTLFQTETGGDNLQTKGKNGDRKAIKKIELTVMS